MAASTPSTPRPIGPSTAHGPSSFARLRILSVVVPLLVLAAALAVSYAVWQRERRDIEHVLKEDFDARVRDAIGNFRQRVQGYEQVLHAVDGLFASSRKVDRNDFQVFVRNLKLDTHPGLQGVGYSVLVPHDQLDRHLAAVRAEGFPAYTIRPAGERPFYTSALYFAPPSAAELSTIGSDYFAEPSRRAALIQARDTAGVAVSNKIRLPGEDPREIQAGFRMVWPVYRTGVPPATVEERRVDIVGWIFVAFSMDGLLGSTVGERNSIAFEVFDGSELQGDEEPVGDDRVGGESALKLFSAARRVEVGGHTWVVSAHALPNFATPIAISQLQLVTAIGGVSSAGLALFTWMLMRRRLRSLRTREELQLARDRAEAANRAKSHFIAAASHDLRQPTQALGLFIATLRAMAKRPDLSGAEVGHIATRLQFALEGLGRLLNGLLDVSRLESGAVEVHRQPIALQERLTQLQHTFAGPAQAKGLTLTVVPTRLWVDSDPVILTRVLSNLLANAVRYTDRGHVLVGCRRRGDLVEVQVLDTGIGIADDQRERIFEEFYQVGRPARDGEHGLGLGLAIVQRSLALIDGSITVRSVPGKGSCFGVLLPRTEPAAIERAAAVQTTPSAQRSLTVLVVDDDPAIREGMRQLLEVWGHRVLSAASVAHALAHADHASGIDLVLTDYRLGEGETGIAVIDGVRSRLGRQVAAAVITGDTSPETVRDVRARGLPLSHKPIDGRRLREVVDASGDDSSQRHDG